MNYTYQAVDNVTGDIYSWSYPDLDFVGAHYPGPGLPTNILQTNRPETESVKVGTETLTSLVASSGVSLSVSNGVGIITAAQAEILMNGVSVSSIVVSPSLNVTVVGSVATVAPVCGRSPAEIEDIVGDALRQCYRVDPGSVTLNSTTISALQNRVGGLPISQATAGNQPTYVTGDAAFGGRPCADFGNTTAHAKVLFNASTRRLDRDFSRFAVYRANVDCSASTGRILGNGDASRLCELYFTGTALQIYNGGGGSVADVDPASLLGHLVVAQLSTNQGPKSGGFLYRSDGLVTHLDSPNIVTVADNGSFAMGGAVFAPVGAPVRIAECGEIFGIPGALQRGGLIRYASERYGWTLPTREVMFDGNSLNVKGTLWPGAIVLPNTQSRYFAAVGGRTIQTVIDALRSSALNETCGVTTLRRAWVGSEISNSIVANVDGPTMVAQLQTLISHIRAAGFTDIVMGTCTPRGGLSGPQETARVYANDWLANNWQSAGVTRLANLHTATAINGQSCPVGLLTATGNATYYLDEAGAWVHNTAAGYTLRGEQYRYWLAELGY
jgi:hypothetical protein